MSYQVKILQTNSEISVESGETILQAAKRQNIPYPFSCSSGRCGACKSRIISGALEHLSHKPATLDDEEKSLGLFLACRAQPKSDLAVSWLEESEEALPALKFEAQVQSLSSLTHDIRKLSVEIPKEIHFKFKPGQFIQLSVGDFEARSYSIASSPGGRTLDFYIRQIAGGRTSTYIHNNLKPGDIVHIEGPFGNAYLRPDHTGPILAVAGGSGAAPIFSILSTALRSGFRQPIHFYFGVRSQKDLFLLAEMTEFSRLHTNFKFQTVIDEETPNFRSGRVGDHILQDWVKFEGLWQAYLAGPPPMIDSIVPNLVERGIRKHNIFSDPFYFQNKDSNS